MGRTPNCCYLRFSKPQQLHTSIFYEILETDMIFFADSKYVNFNKNTYCFLFFSYLFSVITPQLKKHIVSVLSISLSFLNHLKKKLYGALLPPNTHFMTWGSLQPALCVLGGKLELGTTVTTVYQLLRLGQIPTEPRGVVPT